MALDDFDGLAKQYADAQRDEVAAYLHCADLQKELFLTDKVNPGKSDDKARQAGAALDAWYAASRATRAAADAMYDRVKRVALLRETQSQGLGDI